jgi:hypothetical protein
VPPTIGAPVILPSAFVVTVVLPTADSRFVPLA